MSPRSSARPSRRVAIAGVAAALTLTGGLTLAPAHLPLAPAAAHAADSDVVAIPDASLKAQFNAKLGRSSTPDADVTYGDAATLTGSQAFTPPFSDLTGMEALVNATSIGLNGAFANPSTFRSLAPLAGLTRITALSIRTGAVRSLRPLANLTSLTNLTVTGNAVNDVSGLGAITGLRLLSLTGNAISDISGLPNLKSALTVNLNENRIASIATLADKLDAATITTLQLGRNRITDASSLAPLGPGKLSQWTTSSTGLNIAYNRLTDLTPLDSWTRLPSDSQTGYQNLYVGPYQPGGVILPPLRQGVRYTQPLQLDAALGSYDPATGRLTLIDESAASVTLTSSTPGVPNGQQPRFVVSFSTPPVDPADGTPPTVAGDATVWSQLTVTDPGTLGAEPGQPACSTTGLRYQWLRDGEEIVPNPHLIPLDSDTVPLGGNPSNGSSYVVAPRDLGRRLSVRVSCVDTGGQSTSDSSATITNGEAEKPVIGVLDGNQYRDPLAATTVTQIWDGRSGVAFDPDGTRIPFHVGQLGSDGRLIDAAQLSLTVTAENNNSGIPRDPATVLGPDDVEFGGSGANRWITLRPQKETSEEIPGSGVAPPLRVTVTVTGPSGKSEQVWFDYAVSRATTATSRVLVGTSDASTAIAVGDGHLLVADDERTSIRLYDARVSGREVTAFTPGQSTGEIDFEAAARTGDRIFWLGSHGHKKDGDAQPSRSRIFQTRLIGSGASASIEPVGTPYTRLRTDLVTWDNAVNDRRLGLDDTGLGKVRPDALNGFNIEGAEFSPDGSALYLAFRSPVVPAAADGRALIVPLLNVAALTEGSETRARFGDPILLDLGGHSIREIRKNAAGEYLILSATAGPPSGASRQALWAWDGDPAVAPVRLATQVLPDLEPRHSDNAGAWEGIGEMPARLAPGQPIRLLMDQGYVLMYSGGENKEDLNDWTRKSRTDLLELTGPVGTIAASSAGSVAFAAQAAQTTGAPRVVTVTNGGSGKLKIGRVRKVDADGESVHDFLVSLDDCADEVLLPGESCKVGVRFSPARSDATSNATLVVTTNTASGELLVPLTGTSTGLPAGTPGEDGDDGERGADGARGDSGAKGDSGVSGADGAVGPLGPQGPAGPIGPVGPVGPKGDTGPTGRHGAFSLSTSRTAVTRVRRGRSVSVAFRVRNGTAAAVAGSTLTASTPKALKARGARTLKLPQLAAGASRTVRLRLTIGRDAGVGTHTVTVRMQVGGETVTQTVRLRVTR